jgi:hypothetical protein
MLTNFDSLPLDRIHNMLKVSYILASWIMKVGSQRVGRWINE